MQVGGGGDGFAGLHPLVNDLGEMYRELGRLQRSMRDLVRETVNAFGSVLACVELSPTRVTVVSRSSSSTISTVAPNQARPRSSCRAGSTTLAAFIRFDSQPKRRSISRRRLRP